MRQRLRDEGLMTERLSARGLVCWEDVRKGVLPAGLPGEEFGQTKGQESE